MNHILDSLEDMPNALYIGVFIGSALMALIGIALDTLKDYLKNKRERQPVTFVSCRGMSPYDRREPVTSKNIEAALKKIKIKGGRRKK